MSSNLTHSFRKTSLQCVLLSVCITCSSSLWHLFLKLVQLPWPGLKCTKAFMMTSLCCTSGDAEYLIKPPEPLQFLSLRLAGGWQQCNRVFTQHHSELQSSPPLWHFNYILSEEGCAIWFTLLKDMKDLLSLLKPPHNLVIYLRL